ncbi:hypothetical protein [Vibrio phage vB_VhaS-tm]|nr:hypothetical protein [Vibrio phage vB_VhaS-tm]
MNFNTKSKMVGFLLALILGPLGYMYSSFQGGIILTAVAILGSPTIIVPVICWLLAIIMAPSSVGKHNRNVEITMNLLGGRNE